MNLTKWYEYLEDETGMRFSITFWKTTDGKFGARAGTSLAASLGYETPELAISAAIEEMIAKHRNDQSTSPNNVTELG